MKVLLLLARAYDVAIKVNRDSQDKELLQAYRPVALKAPFLRQAGSRSALYSSDGPYLSARLRCSNVACNEEDKY